MSCLGLTPISHACQCSKSLARLAAGACDPRFETSFACVATSSGVPSFGACRKPRGSSPATKALHSTLKAV